MKTLLKIFALLIFGSVFLIACDSTNNEPGEGNNETLIPLQAGNTWTFNDKFPENETVTFTVGSNHSINGEEYSEVEVTYTDEDTDGETFFAGYKDIGLYLGQGAPFAEFPLKNPAEDGEIYTHTDEDGNQYTITVTNKNVSVPAGDFSCLEYDINVDGAPSEIVCISPEIGSILFGNQNSDFTAELISFDIN